MTTTMEIQRTEDGLQMTCGIVDRDFHVRLEGDKWVLDEFDTDVEDNNSAHLESSNHESLIEAINEAFDRCEEILNVPR